MKQRKRVSNRQIPLLYSPVFSLITISFLPFANMLILLQQNLREEIVRLKSQIRQKDALIATLQQKLGLLMAQNEYRPRRHF